jgi:hypothetical protein
VILQLTGSLGPAPSASPGVVSAAVAGWPTITLPSIDPILALALLLLVGGVIGSALPGVPGPLGSLAGLYGVWWTTGYTHPGLPLLALLTACGVAAVVVDWVAGPVAARAGGASLRTILIASAVGLIGLLGGPVLAVGLMVATVFVLELDRAEDLSAGLRTAGVTVAGILASVGVQVLLTAAMLVGVLASLAG